MAPDHDDTGAPDPVPAESTPQPAPTDTTVSRPDTRWAIKAALEDSETRWPPAEVPDPTFVGIGADRSAERPEIPEDTGEYDHLAGLDPLATADALVPLPEPMEEVPQQLLRSRRPTVDDQYDLYMANPSAYPAWSTPEVAVLFQRRDEAEHQLELAYAELEQARRDRDQAPERDRAARREAREQGTTAPLRAHQERADRRVIEAEDVVLDALVAANRAKSAAAVRRLTRDQVFAGRQQGIELLREQIAETYRMRANLDAQCQQVANLSRDLAEYDRDFTSLALRAAGEQLQATDVPLQAGSDHFWAGAWLNDVDQFLQRQPYALRRQVDDPEAANTDPVPVA
jgi:hypothetical protein